jgi:DNA invertase Pin-like site-specific DNA recombinase
MRRIFTEQMSGAVTDRPALHDALEFARSGDTLSEIRSVGRGLVGG